MRKEMEGLTPLAAEMFSVRTLAAMPESVKRRLMSGGELLPIGKRERLERTAAEINREPGELSDYDCPECKNKGYIACVKDGKEICHKECACMKKRRYFRGIRESGLSEMLTRYTFEAWQCREAWQKETLDMARRYAEHPQGWLCIAGRPGTGKTHLCTALCGKLIERGYSVRYMLWRNVATEAKAVVNDREAYGEIVEPLIKTDVLYIDDFFKAGRAYNRNTGQREPMNPTEGDINLAWKIINDRYCDSRCLTIISTEMTLGQILNIDEAVGSRIAERTRGGRYQDLTEKSNWRLTAF